MKHQTCTTAVGEAAYGVGVMSHRFYNGDAGLVSDIQVVKRTSAS